AFSKDLFSAEGVCIWFSAKTADWTVYSELVFTLRNPGKEAAYRMMLLEYEVDGETRRGYLPARSTIPGGQLMVPGESEVTFRLNLKDPVMAENFNLKQVTRFCFYKGTEDVTFYLSPITLVP